MIAPGLAEKTPLWRAGAWLAGAGILIGVPLGDGLGGIVRVLMVAGGGFLLSVPYGIHRLRGREPWRPPVERVRVRELSPAAYLAYLLLYRLPVAVGDGIFTWIWNALARDPLWRRPERRGPDDDTGVIVRPAGRSGR